MNRISALASAFDRRLLTLPRFVERTPQRVERRVWHDKSPEFLQQIRVDSCHMGTQEIAEKYNINESTARRWLRAAWENRP